MNTVEKRLVLALCVVVGVSFVVGASLTLMLTPMLDDLGLTSEEAATALALPSVASLLVVFAVGRMGDRLGHRRIIVWASGPFVVGSVLVASATVMPMVSLGLVLAGASATAIQIVALGLLQASIPEGRARISAFTSYGMVFPIVYLVFPVLTGWMVGVTTWRLVPVVWAVLGLLVPLFALWLIERPGRPLPVGELWTPFLAGLTVAGIVQVLNGGHDSGWTSPRTLIAFTVTVVAAVTCALILRSSRATSLSLAPLRSRTTLLLLVGVALVAMASTLTYVTLALEYLYGRSVFATAILLVPAEAAAVIGAKVVASRLMRTWGTARAGRFMLAAFAITLLLLLLTTETSPMWLLIASTSVFTLFGFGSITIVNAAVMSGAATGDAGMTSAYRGASSSLGAALSVVILGTLISGVVVTTSTSGVGEIPDAAAMVAGLRSNGLVGAAIAALAWAAFALASRERVDQVKL